MIRSTFLNNPNHSNDVAIAVWDTDDDIKMGGLQDIIFGLAAGIAFLTGASKKVQAPTRLA